MTSGLAGLTEAALTKEPWRITSLWPSGHFPCRFAGSWVTRMRRARAGYGDPPGFRLDDCATQRNLSEAGRAHARRAGEAFRAHGVAFDRALTSPWCRCKETALLALGREAEPLTPLSNLVGRYEHRDGQVKALKAYLAALHESTRSCSSPMAPSSAVWPASPPPLGRW